VLPLNFNSINKHEGEIPATTFVKLLHIFKEEINLLVKLKPLNDTIIVNACQLFELIAGHKCKFITKEKLQIFMINNGFYLLDKCAELIIQRLDLDCDKKVSYSDFSDFFIPADSNLLMITPTLKKDTNDPLASNEENTQSSAETNKVSSFNIGIDNSIINKNPTHTLHAERYKNIRRKLIPKDISENLNANTSITIYNEPKVLAEFDTAEKEILTKKWLSPLVRMKEPVREFTPLKVLKSSNGKKLAEFFKEQIEIDKQTEDVREWMCLHVDYNIRSVFKFFASEGVISITSLKKGLMNLGVFKSSKVLSIVMKRYDVNQDNGLSYEEFENMLIPGKEHYNKLLKERVMNEEEMKKETKESLNKLMTTIIDNELHIEKIKRTAIKQLGINNLIGEFTNLDKYNKGYLNAQEVLFICIIDCTFYEHTHEIP